MAGGLKVELRMSLINGKAVFEAVEITDHVL